MRKKLDEKKIITVTSYAGKFAVGCKCPACSSEVDKGGRMVLKKAKYKRLVCDRCKYTIKSIEAQESQRVYWKKREERSGRI